MNIIFFLIYILDTEKLLAHYKNYFSYFFIFQITKIHRCVRISLPTYISFPPHTIPLHVDTPPTTRFEILHTHLGVLKALY